MQTFHELLTEGTQLLVSAGIEEARLDAWLLLLKILRWQPCRLLWQAPEEITLYCCFSILLNSFFRSS